MRWTKENSMTLHEDKFEYIMHKCKPKTSFYELPFISREFTYSATSGKTMYQVEVVRDLGVTVLADMSWSQHIQMVASRAKAVASWGLSAF